MSELRERILALRRQGQSYRDIQAQLGCSRGTIAYYLGTGVKEKALRRQNHNRRVSIIELKRLYGGACTICGYSKCSAALEFHHTDPKTKFKEGVSDKSLTVSQIYKEATKCQLVCANCHREIHFSIESSSRNTTPVRGVE